MEEEGLSLPETDSRHWVNKQRTLVFCSRGVSYRARHLMLDVRTTCDAFDLTRCSSAP